MGGNAGCVPRKEMARVSVTALLKVTRRNISTSTSSEALANVLLVRCLSVCGEAVNTRVASCKGQRALGAKSFSVLRKGAYLLPLMCLSSWE